MGYADPDTPTTSAPAALPLLLHSEPDQPLRQGLLLLVFDSPCIHHHQRLKTMLRVFCINQPNECTIKYRTSCCSRGFRYWRSWCRNFSRSISGSTCRGWCRNRNRGISNGKTTSIRPKGMSMSVTILWSEVSEGERMAYTLDEPFASLFFRLTRERKP